MFLHQPPSVWPTRSRKNMTIEKKERDKFNSETAVKSTWTSQIPSLPLESLVDRCVTHVTSLTRNTPLDVTQPRTGNNVGKLTRHCTHLTGNSSSFPPAALQPPPSSFPSTTAISHSASSSLLSPLLHSSPSNLPFSPLDRLHPHYCPCHRQL